MGKHIRKEIGYGILVLVLVSFGLGCKESEIITYSQLDGKLYLIDKDTYAQTELSDLSAFAIENASALTFATEDTLYLHRGLDTTLFEVDVTDPASPAVTEIGDCPNCGGGMALCDDGLLYSVTGDPSQLYIIDPATAQGTLVGDLGISTGTTGLTCDPGTDELYVFGGNVDALYTIDKATGAATLVGPAGIDVVGAVGLEFDPLSPYTLYASLDVSGSGSFALHRLDPATGAATYLSALPMGNKNLAARVVEKEE